MFSHKEISKLLSESADCFVLGYIKKFFNYQLDLYFWMHLNVWCK